jgi:hypothetical protein
MYQTRNLDLAGYDRPSHNTCTSQPFKCEKRVKPRCTPPLGGTAPYTTFTCLASASLPLVFLCTCELMHVIEGDLKYVESVIESFLHVLKQNSELGKLYYNCSAVFVTTISQD